MTADQITEARQSNRARSIEVIKKLREAGSQGAEAAATSGAGPEASKKSGKLKVVSVDDEVKLLKYYATKIQGICRALGFPHKVQATALIFLKRAYLSFSCLDHDPKNVMLTCIYLAGKVEESYIDAENFSRAVNQEEAVVLRGELILLEALSYDLIVYTPFRALQGFCLDLEDFQAQQADKEKLGQLQAKARGAADVLMLTDAPLIYPPGQLALAALRSGMKSVGLEFEKFAEHVRKEAKLPSQVAALSSLPAVLQQIDCLGLEGSAPIDEQEVRKIDRKLKQCHNPLLDPSSEEFKKAAAEEEERKARNKAQKAAAKRARFAATQATLLGGSPMPLKPKANEEEPPVKKPRP